MRILMKVLLLVVLTMALMVTGFALGYPIGRHRGYELGSEWAMLQAKLAAREAGVIMPVYYEDGLFHVVIRPSAPGPRKAVQTARYDDARDAAPVALSEGAAAVESVAAASAAETGEQAPVLDTASARSSDAAQ